MMEIYKVLACLVCVVGAPITAHRDQQNPVGSSNAEAWREILMRKLDSKMLELERKLLEIESATKLALENHLKKFNAALLVHRETIDGRLTHHETFSQGLLTTMNELSETIGNNLTALKMDRELATQHLVRTNENLLGAIDQLSQVISRNLTKLETQSDSAIETINMKLSNQETRLETLQLSINGRIEKLDHELSKTIGNNFNAVQNQLNMTLKKDRELATQHLVRTNENLLEGIHQLSQEISRNLTKLETQSGSAIDAHRDAINRKLFNQETRLETLQLSINGRIEKLDHKFTALQTLMSNKDSQQEALDKQQALWNQIQMLTSHKGLARFIITSGLDVNNISSRPCKDEQWQESGQYMIRAAENTNPFLGYCDQSIFGGGWLVIQYRFDGSIDFYRNWSDYRMGFGSIDGEYWLGLENLYQLTKRKKYELLVELEDFEGNYKYARYNHFEIGSEEDKYPLKVLGSYSGTAGDSLKHHKGMKFTTKDQKNDLSTGKNCAITYQGAWWYYACHTSNLNGLYENSNKNPKAMVWKKYQSQQGLAYSRMLIRLS